MVTVKVVFKVQLTEIIETKEIVTSEFLALDIFRSYLDKSKEEIFESFKLLLYSSFPKATIIELSSITRI